MGNQNYSVAYLVLASCRFNSDRSTHHPVGKFYFDCALDCVLV